MGRKSRSAAHAPRATTHEAAPKIPPFWAVIWLAVAGMVLTAYLAYVNLSGSAAALCSAGSGCDLVQQSRWSSFLGIPAALWGSGLYALIALVALSRGGKVKRWRRLFSLSLFGLVYSLFLTAVGAIDLSAFCFWCLTSLALLVAIFVLVLKQRPPTALAEGWKRWILNHAIVLLPLIAVIGVVQAGALARPVDPRVEALAVHLKQSGAKFYGANWCAHCRDQKALFGKFADALPYVECAPNGPNTAIAYECASAGVNSFPTWIIRGQRHLAVLKPEELARLSRFAAWNAPQRSDRAAEPASR